MGLAANINCDGLDTLAEMLLNHARMPASASEMGHRVEAPRMQTMARATPMRPATGKDLLRKKKVDTYALTWTSKAEKYFESPTGGKDMMLKGENMMYFAKKEQAHALGRQLKSQFKITDWKIYRIFPDG